jgi:TrpR family trp operon transcriptional repressor
MTLNDERVKKNIEELCRVLAETKDRKMLESFFSCLLTPAEMADIAARWALVKALRDGQPQREIAKTLGVSLCKITRGSRELKTPGSGFSRILAVLDNLNTER